MYPNILELSRRFALVLASASPRRQKLLSEMGCSYSIETHDIAETQRPGERPFAFAQRLAEEKALSVKGGSHEIALGFDTIVVLGDRVRGKPVDADDALRMLTMLAGHKHVVCTAVAFARGGQLLASDFDTTSVYFHPVSVEQLGNYVAGGEPMDKAGAYGIQGMGGFLVDRIEGNLDTVIGLPRGLLDRMAAGILHEG
ncbi:MAG: septum formation protein Maf [candidate division Zixibacteria bacterium]|nr:septum formation protein Maf [candidate division Zixibacteria bacterium]